ncbi:protein tyrosine phosphatase receptor type B [Clonorchis sinensis]|uniref:Protein tyrosine phosphatase receptor type B n=1 Tax=Clonorchis sinensis TaxID=79923 RepID=G7YEK3_CLOSI|nr:protein tyrosine phosphatase receptor type B [Clonorchis sinensis]
MVSGTPGRIIEGLEDCTEYQYTVGSGWEYKQKTLKTLPATLLPANVTALLISPTTIEVNWNAPPCSESIDHVNYSVVVKPLNKGLEAIKQKVAEDFWREGPVEFRVEPCTAYVVYIEVDAMGTKDRSELIRVTDEKKPNVTVVNIEPGVQKVSWTDPSTTPECKHLYEVQQNNVDTGEHVTTIVSATERIFVQLTHCTNYEYTVRVVGEYVRGRKSDPVRLVTKSPKPETPTLLDVNVAGPTSVTLTWSTPIPHDRCSHTRYIVTAQAADAPLIQTTTDLQYTTLTVESCNSYLVAVQAQYSDGTLSEKSKFGAVTTAAHEPVAPVHLRVSMNAPHKQVLKWREPDPLYKCPHMYELERSEIGPKGTHVTHVRFYSITHEYVVLSLKPRTTNSYRLRVIGLPGNVVGPYSAAVKQTTTEKETLSGTLSDYMTAIDSTENTISVHLKFSSLLKIPDLNILSLVVQPQHEQTYIRHESAMLVKNGLELLDQSWKDRIHNRTGPWELKLWDRSKHTLLQTADDATIILGQTAPCSDSPYCEPGQLMPGAIYGIQLRIYSPNGVFTSRQIFASTKTDLICLRILIGVVAAVAGCAIIFAKFAYTYHTSASWNRLGPEAVKVENEQKPEKANKKRSWTEHMQRVGRYSIMRDDEEGSSFRRTGYMPTTSVVQTGRTIGELRAYLDECLQPTSMQLDEQFTTLRQDCLKREIDENMTTNYATDPKNHALNRYPDIIPYDHTAVLLSGSNPLKNEIEYYINASHIYAINPSKDAQSAPKLNPARVDYIAAQAPLKKTIADFWEMIAENHVSLIVMLTQLVEDNVPKCARYWPDEVYATTIHMSHGNELAVTLISEEDYPSYIIRKISLVTGSEDAASTTVTQLQMKVWPEHGVPYLADFTAVINEYQKLKLIEENRGAPTLVHCSTGAARSGVFIAADIIKRQLDSGEGLSDIQGTVALLRECRMHMVQKVNQYVFLHQYVRSLLNGKA